MRPTINNPKGINAVIETLTKNIAANTPLIDNDYGQAVAVYKKLNDREYRIPAIPKENTYIEMFPEGGKDNILFAIAHDPCETLHQSYENALKQQAISVIVWIDQNKYGTYAHSVTDDIIEEITETIRKHGGIRARIQNIYKEPQNVYQGFDYSLIQTQFLMYPYTGFRINYQVTFNESC